MKKFAVLTATIAAAFSAQAADKITYDDQILPIFRNACLNCHNPDKKKAGLDLSTYDATLQGSENGKVVQSGNAATSLLFKCVKQTEDPKMPPKGDKLSDAELSIVEKWINGQLLENATGKAVAAASNNVSVAVVSLERPAGPPPMPGDLPLEPYVRTKSLNALTALAANPWAPVVAIGGQKQVLLYNTETLAPLGVLSFPEGLPTIIRFSRNGQLLLTGGGLGGKSGKVVLWDLKTGERIATIGNEFDQVLAADLSADQQFIALGGPNKLLKIYRTKDGKLVQTIKKHTDWVTAISYSPDGKYLASADRSGGIQIWEGATGKEFNTLPGHKAMVTGLSFMPGVLASSSEDGKVSLWDAKEGKEIRTWSAHPGGTAWVDFTPDGRLVSCGRDKIAKVWDQTGKALGQTQPMNDIALRSVVSNDRVVVGDWTGLIRVCSLDGKVLGELTANPPTLADRVAVSTKSQTDATASIPVLEQQFGAATAKLKTDQLAVEEKRKAAIATAEQKRADAQKSLENAKAAIPTAEKQVADLKAQLPALQQTLATATQAAEAAQKAVTDKQTAPAPAPEIESAQKEATAKAAERDAAKKSAEAKQAEVTKAEAALTALRPQQPAKIASLEKYLTAVIAQVAESQKPPAAPDATVAADDKEVTKLKTALDAAKVQLAAAKAELEHWKVAQVYQTAYDARLSLAGKQARYEQFVQVAKDAPQAIDKAHTDLADSQKTITEGPAKIQAQEKAFTEARQAVDAAKQTLATAEKDATDKDAAAKAVLDAAPAVGDVAGLTKKLETQNAELIKMREARNALTRNTPEFNDLNTKFQAFKNDVAKTQTDLTAASAKNMEAPAIKESQAAVEKARAALDAARLALKNVVKTAATAEKSLADAKKALTDATQLAARLEKDMPEIVKTAETQKAQAEQAAAAAAQEVEAAKTEAEKRRADYETLKNGAPKAAALSAVPNKS